MMTLSFSKMYSEMAALPKAWVVFTSLLILIIYLAEKSSRFYRKYRFPNPVPGLPILGNTFQMPNDGQGPYMKQLDDKYGEMSVCLRRCTVSALCAGLQFQ